MDTGFPRMDEAEKLSHLCLVCVNPWLSASQLRSRRRDDSSSPRHRERRIIQFRT